MNGVVGCWFSFAGDASAICESVPFFREHNPGAKVAVFDDQWNQLPEAVLAEIQPDLIERTQWDRGGNLNGWDAVLGILDSMERACIALDAKGAVKVDCDTMTRLAGWLDLTRPHIGLDLGTMPLASGHSYWVRRDAIGAALDSLLSPERRLLKEMVMEDYTISAELLRLFPDSVIHLRGKPPLVAGWNFQKDQEGYKDVPVVTFDHRSLRGKRSEKLKQVVVAMKKYRKWLSTH